jgi:YkgG family uncharacterized protein
MSVRSGIWADVDFAIVRASFAVAETGSVLLNDADLRVNGVAYLAQHLIVLLDPADIVVNLHHAYRRPEFRERLYASFHTGPSATAESRVCSSTAHRASARSPSCRSREQLAIQLAESPETEEESGSRLLIKHAFLAQRAFESFGGLVD